MTFMSEFNNRETLTILKNAVKIVGAQSDWS